MVRGWIPKFIPHPTGQVKLVNLIAKYGHPKEVGLSSPVRIQMRRHMVTYGQGLKWVTSIHCRENNWRRGEKWLEKKKKALGLAQVQDVMAREEGDGTPESLSSLQLISSGIVLGSSKVSRSSTVWGLIKMVWAAFLLKFFFKIF